MANLSLHHDTHGEIQFKYHPETRKRSYSSGWKSTPVAGTDDPILIWGGGEGKKYSFTVEMTSSEATHAERLWVAGQAEPWKRDSPPVWKLVIGQKVVPVVIESLEFEESFFGKDLQPDLFTVTITMQKWREYKLSVS